MYRLAGDGDWLIVRRSECVRFPDRAGDGHWDLHCLCSLSFGARRGVVYCFERAE